MNVNPLTKKISIAVVIVAVLVAGYVAYLFLSKSLLTCWPYCPGMTDNEREQIKKEALVAEQKVNSATEAKEDINKNTTTVEKLITFQNPEYGISFSYPAKYTNALSSEYLPLLQYRDYQKVNATLPDTIDVRWLPFKSGDSSEQSLINDVSYDGSGANPESFDEFTLIRLGDNDYYKIRTGLFEGVLGYRYYLLKTDGAFVFVLTSLGVPWTDQKFNPEKETRHFELQEILKTVRLII